MKKKLSPIFYKVTYISLFSLTLSTLSAYFFSFFIKNNLLRNVSVIWFIISFFFVFIALNVGSGINKE